MITILLQLIRVFAPLSFLTIGGGQSIIPEIHRQSVEIHGWLSAGALAASIAIFLPSALLIYYLATIWKRYEGTRMIRAIEAGLLPIAAGMILAASGTILKAAQGGLWAWTTALACAAALLLSRINPLWLLAGGGLLFAVIQPAS